MFINSPSTIHGLAEAPSTHVNQKLDESSGSESEIEFVQETDMERRQTLLHSEESRDGEADRFLGKGLLWKDFDNEFNFKSSQQGEDAGGSKAQRQGSIDVIELTDDSEDGEHCDIPAASGTVFTTGQKTFSKGKQKGGSRLSSQTSCNVPYISSLKPSNPHSYSSNFSSSKSK